MWGRSGGAAVSVRTYTFQLRECQAWLGDSPSFLTRSTTICSICNALTTSPAFLRTAQSAKGRSTGVLPPVDRQAGASQTNGPNPAAFFGSVVVCSCPEVSPDSNLP